MKPKSYFNWGEVYLYPPSSDPDDDQEYRPHVLLVDCTDESVTSSLAFASRQPTEASFGAPNTLVDPHARSYSRTGFDHPTYVYPSRIVNANPEDLDNMRGKILDEMALIREELAKALGIGTGTRDGSRGAAGSYRGTILRVPEVLEREIETPLVLVVSEPRYSNAFRYQNVVPIVSALRHDPAGTDVVVQGAEWLAAFSPEFAETFLYTEAVFALWSPTQAIGIAPTCVSEATMADLDTALSIYFSL